MKKRISLFVAFVSLIAYLLSFHPLVFESSLRDMGIDTIRFAVPTILCLSLASFAYLNRKRFWWVLVFLKIPLELMNAKSLVTYKNTLLQDDTYILNTGTLGPTIYTGQYAKTPETGCYSLQSGRVRFFIGKYETFDTVIVRMSPNDFILDVHSFNPSVAEIQKYMEPVLYVDGVEQPRPNYDGLNLSPKEKELRMCQYHLQAATVVKKERDQFLRNLVTFKVNDTLQQTVNLMYKDEKEFEDIFESIVPGESKAIIKVSDVDPRVIKVVNWRPTQENLQRMNPNVQIDVKMFNEVMHKSTKRTGVLKGRFVKNKRYYAIVSVNDSVQGKVEIVDEHDKKVFRDPDFEDGGFVLIRVSDIMPQVFTIINWHPTPEEVEKYKTPVKLIEKKQ